MIGALPQNQFQNLSHSPESIEGSVIFQLCAARHRTIRICPFIAMTGMLVMITCD
jgi:hypothetical protein